MRIEQLEYLTAVARLGSFRAAAEELHVSQPALSEAIRRLERELRVELLERARTGTRLSASGRDLLPHARRVLDAVDRLRLAAHDRHRSQRVVRVGTVHAATSPLLVPAVHGFRASHPATQVEVVTGRGRDLRQALLDGALDLALVNVLDGDDLPPELASVELLRSPPVACMRTDSPLAARPRISPAELAAHPLVAMRPGYVMHRYLHRFLDGLAPAVSYAADGAEMGKHLVADGLGVTVLPAFSVDDDPLVRSGVLVRRPLTDEGTAVRLVAHHARSDAVPASTRDLLAELVARAAALDVDAEGPAAAAAGPAPTPPRGARRS
ncbi:LysR family transcriptional regulator [Patulibacter sp. S7RM1-6]